MILRLRLQQESMAGIERLKKEKRIYEASLKGSVDSLKQLLLQDPLALARAVFRKENLLISVIKSLISYQGFILSYQGLILLYQGLMFSRSKRLEN